MKHHVNRRAGAHVAKRATRPSRTTARIAKLSGTGVLASGAVLALGTAFATPSYASTTSTCNATGTGAVHHSTSHTECYAYNHSTAGATASPPYDDEGFPPAYAEAGNYSSAHSTIVGDSQASSYAHDHSTATASATSGAEGEAYAKSYANHSSQAHASATGKDSYAKSVAYNNSTAHATANGYNTDAQSYSYGNHDTTSATATGANSRAYSYTDANNSQVTTTASNGGHVSVSTHVDNSTGYGLARGNATGDITTSHVYDCSSGSGGFVIAFTSTGTRCVSADGHTTVHQ